MTIMFKSGAICLKTSTRSADLGLASLWVKIPLIVTLVWYSITPVVGTLPLIPDGAVDSSHGFLEFTGQASAGRPGYDLEPSIMLDEDADDGLFKMWWLGQHPSPAPGQPADRIYYSSAPEANGPWSEPVPVIEPRHGQAPDGLDWADDHLLGSPSVLKFDGYYWMFYEAYGMYATVVRQFYSNGRTDKWTTNGFPEWLDENTANPDWVKAGASNQFDVYNELGYEGEHKIMGFAPRYQKRGTRPVYAYEIQYGVTDKGYNRFLRVGQVDADGFRPFRALDSLELPELGPKSGKIPDGARLLNVPPSAEGEPIKTAQPVFWLYSDRGDDDLGRVPLYAYWDGVNLDSYTSSDPDRAGRDYNANPNIEDSNPNFEEESYLLGYLPGPDALHKKDMKGCLQNRIMLARCPIGADLSLQSNWQRVRGNAGEGAMIAPTNEYTSVAGFTDFYNGGFTGHRYWGWREHLPTENERRKRQHEKWDICRAYGSGFPAALVRDGFLELFFSDDTTDFSIATADKPLQRYGIRIPRAKAADPQSYIDAPRVPTDYADDIKWSPLFQRYFVAGKTAYQANLHWSDYSPDPLNGLDRDGLSHPMQRTSGGLVCSSGLIGNPLGHVIEKLNEDEEPKPYVAAHLYFAQQTGGSECSSNHETDLAHSMVFLWPDPAHPEIDRRIDFDYYHGDWVHLPDFDLLTPTYSGTVRSFDLSRRDRDDHFGFRFRTFLEIDEEGFYTFFVSSDDGSRVSINGSTVTDNDGLHAVLTGQGSIYLPAGHHRLEVEYFENGGGESLLVEYEGPGKARQVIPVAQMARSGSLPSRIRESAEISSPSVGGALNAGAQTFAWNHSVGATGYRLTLGTTIGGQQIWNGSQSTDSSQLITGIPTDGRDLWVRLYTYFGTNFPPEYRDYAFNAVNYKPGEIVSPAVGSVLGSHAPRFTWSPGRGVTAYQVVAGSAEGLADLYSSLEFEPHVTSAGAWLLPTNGKSLWVGLRSQIPGQGWVQRNYQYTAYSSEPSVMVSPSPNSVIGGSTAIFEFSGGLGAAEYRLVVGNSVGASDIFDSGKSTVVSHVVNSLPADGRTIYVRLLTHLPGTDLPLIDLPGDEHWVATDYQYTSAAVQSAVLSSPWPGSSMNTKALNFQWGGDIGATAYQLLIGNAAGSSNYFDGPVVTTRNVQVNDLPVDGRLLYIRLRTELTGGVGWVHNDYVVNAATLSAAEMESPAAGAQLSGETVTFSYTAGSGATQYRLEVGSTQGEDDVFALGTFATSVSVVGLPVRGQDVWVRLWTDIPGKDDWEYIDYHYVAADPYRDWIEGLVSPSVLSDPEDESLVWGLDADPDGDGYANGLEFYFNTNPFETDPDPIFSAIEDGELCLWFPRRKDVPAGWIRAEVSSDALTWHTEGIRYENDGDIDEDTEWVMAAVAMGDSVRMFMHVVTSEQ